MSTPNPASDLLVSASAHVVGVLAEALALHQWRRQDHCTIAYRAYCHCGWTQDVVGTHKTELALHSEHVASVVAALPNIAIAVGDPFDATPEQMRFAAAVVAGSFETGDWDSPRTGRKLLDIAAARAAGGQA